MDVMKILISVLLFTSVVGVMAGNLASNYASGNGTTNITGGALVLYGLITLFVIIGFIKYITRSAGVSK